MQVNVQVGMSSLKLFSMQLVSNSPFTDKEWDRWIKTYAHEKKDLPFKSFSDSKAQDLEKARNYAFNDVCIGLI
jgi:hypothetical protein